ncbi:uncharacterized protein LOC129318543 [Prosopis cineraria]|uniref:uncharacterized protein LOC129318543 n=1 Tax=Prosopis cineraria TaxID=364024 RepID=UPI00240FCB2C|nr:uncharacterized protein LOC129318543 [Prosopis cineraria]
MMMGSYNRDREEALTFITNPSSSSPITVSDQLECYLTDPTSLIGSASGSFQSDSLLGAGELGSTNVDLEFGFSRPDFRQSPLPGTVDFYQRHVFLCYKNPRFWPPRIEASEFDRLPRLLHAAVMARKSDMKKETCLTICEGHDGTETSNGDVLIFPDMVRYRRLTHFDVETFVEEVLVKDGEWLPGTPEALRGSHIFVCSHGSRDRRCGVCGPVLVSKFREEIELHGLQGKVFVSPCSHIGGHKYAGNVIIFGSNINGEVMGHWYGFVTPDDVSVLLQQHIIKGEIWDLLWRGQMGIPEDMQKKNQEQRLRLKGMRNIDESHKTSILIQNSKRSSSLCRSQDNSVSCCPENKNFSCCQDDVFEEKISNSDAMETEAKLSADNNSSSINRLVSQINSGKGVSRRKLRSMPMWLDSWEKEDTYAALAVVCAAVSVAIAYSCYKQLK